MKLNEKPFSGNITTYLMVSCSSTVIVVYFLLEVVSFCSASSCKNEAKESGGCKPGIALPVWMPDTNISTGDRVCRALVYFLVLCYMFLGVSVIAGRETTSGDRDNVKKKRTFLI